MARRMSSTIWDESLRMSSGELPNLSISSRTLAPLINPKTPRSPQLKTFSLSSSSFATCLSSSRGTPRAMRSNLQRSSDAEGAALRAGFVQPNMPQITRDGFSTRSFRMLPGHNVYAKEDPSFIGTLKADILALRGKINELCGNPNPEASELILTIAKYTSSDDLLVEMQSRLSLMEIRDHQMLQLEGMIRNALHSDISSSSNCTPHNPDLRTQSYLHMVDLLLTFVKRWQETRQIAREREARSHSMEGQLRQALSTIETQKKQLQECQLEEEATHDRLESELEALQVEVTAMQASSQQLRESLAALQEENEDLKKELNWFHKERDRLMRETSFLGLEVKELTQAIEAPQKPPNSPETVVCDRCPTLHAQCNLLLQEKEELRAIARSLKDECGKTFLENKEVRRQLTNHNDEVHQLTQELKALASQHQIAISIHQRQETMMILMRHLVMQLIQGHLLQVEAGERLALMAKEHMDLCQVLQHFFLRRPPSGTEMEVVVMLHGPPEASEEEDSMHAQNKPTEKPRSLVYRTCTSCQETKDKAAFHSHTWLCNACHEQGLSTSKGSQPKPAATFHLPDLPQSNSRRTTLYGRCLTCQDVKTMEAFQEKRWICDACCDKGRTLIVEEG